MSAIWGSGLSLAGVLITVYVVSCTTDETLPAGSNTGLPASDAASDPIDASGQSDGPAISPTPCDLAAPACDDPAAKCSVIQNGGRYESVCVAGGSTALDDECERSSVGRDNCATGLMCTRLGVREPDRLECRQLCTASDQCEGSCYRFSRGQEEVYGVCLPECVFLQTQCGDGLHCIPVLDAEGVPIAICDEYGPGGEGDACTTANDCGQNLGCTTPEGRCRSYCDDAQPCSDTTRYCEPLNHPSLPGLGVCLPLAP